MKTKHFAGPMICFVVWTVHGMKLHGTTIVKDDCPKTCY